MKETSLVCGKQHLISFLLFLIAIGSIYSNTFSASWHLDDPPNIIDNIYLHLDNLSAKSLINTFYTNPRNPFELSDKMYRPVACLSFALNWYFGKDSVFGYHLVNIAIHIITAFFLYLFLLNILQIERISISPNPSPQERGIQETPSPLMWQIIQAGQITAFLIALLWAVHPIQTQAVTYIVQRMASMSAMFYIMGMFFYLKGRLIKKQLETQGFASLTIFKNASKNFVWYICCVICFILSVGSKENGIMLPISILLVEIIFFSDLGDKETVKRFLIVASIIGLLLLLLGTFLFLSIDIFSKLYEKRTFSLIERLLVQPRVLVFHLSQILFPLPERFSIAHDFVLSSSPFKPWTTIPAIMFIFGLIGFAFYQVKRQPLISFAILFFFINHIIESTIIPLEIVFEHRNYLPSMFLFLPIIFWCSHLINKFSQEKQVVKYWFVMGLLIATAISFSASTYVRNRVWKDDITLWSDAFKKAPNNARAANILAIKLAWGDNSRHPKRYDLALQLFEKSLKMDMPSVSTKADIIENMAGVYSNNKKDYKKAIELYQEALKINPESFKIRRDMVITLILMANYDEALSNIDLLISRNDKNWRDHNLKGFILLWQSKYDLALINFQKALKLLQSDNQIPSNAILLNTGVTLSLKDKHKIASEILEDIIKDDMLAEKVNPDNMPIYLALIENSLRSNDEAKAKEYSSRMVILFGKETVLNNIPVLTDNRASAPISRKVVEPFIRDFIENM